MPTTPYVGGPAGIFVGVGGGATGRRPLLLGVCEDSPKVQIKREWIPLMNALGGTQLPSDLSYQGENALVRCDFTRWDEDVYAAISCAHSPYGNGVRGTDQFGTLGALAATEGIAYPLTVRLPYAGVKRSYANMPPAYRFLQTVLDGPDDLGPLSTRPRRLSLVWQCIRLFNNATLSWTLYDHSIAGLPKFG